MKKVIISATWLVALIMCSASIFASCNGTSTKQAVNESTNPEKIDYMDYMNVKDKSFEDLFIKVDSADIMPILTKLILEEANTVITAGGTSLYNSQMANWQVLGNYFRQPTPTTLCLLGATRYTLEFIKEYQSYTMSLFPDEHKAEAMKFGFRSGRDSNKMEETKLTHVLTPSGNSTYKEASIVIECQLFEITTVHPNDFYTEEGRKFVEEGSTDNKGDYHKLVFGRVTNVWIRK